jgi:hypothetical protein
MRGGGLTVQRKGKRGAASWASPSQPASLPASPERKILKKAGTTGPAHDTRNKDEDVDDNDASSSSSYAPDKYIATQGFVWRLWGARHLL